MIRKNCVNSMLTSFYSKACSLMNCRILSLSSRRFYLMGMDRCGKYSHKQDNHSVLFEQQLSLKSEMIRTLVFASIYLIFLYFLFCWYSYKDVWHLGHQIKIMIFIKQPLYQNNTKRNCVFGLSSSLTSLELSAVCLE